ncbi:MAG: AAA family ATPase, partial [Candidatus Margulisiibacteriota bacterium]
MKPLPIGSQTFEHIIQGNGVYVDKTQYIYALANAGSDSNGVGPKFFLSRPRRFGKSLTISTLDALFSGRRELFEGLWITQNTDYAFETFPVLRFDLSNIGKEDGHKLAQSLCFRMHDIAKIYGVKIDQARGVGQQFEQLIRGVAAQTRSRVVVLVDEYDAPIIRHITDVKKAADNREVLREFYTTLKAEDAHMRFVLLTGVSKFSKVSVFSGLNNLQDLTMDARYATFLGYTQEELEFYFKDRIEALAETEQLTVPEILDKIKHWYNGYRFSKAETKVYNPFSTLLLLEQKDFKAHWFETGTPTFLVELIKQKNF